MLVKQLAVTHVLPVPMFVVVDVVIPATAVAMDTDKLKSLIARNILFKNQGKAPAAVLFFLP